MKIVCVFIIFLVYLKFSYLFVKCDKSQSENNKSRSSVKNYRNNSRGNYYTNSEHTYRNHSENAKNETRNVLKTEAAKFLKECGVDLQEDPNMNDNFNSRNSNRSTTTYHFQNGYEFSNNNNRQNHDETDYWKSYNDHEEELDRQKRRNNGSTNDGRSGFMSDYFRRFNNNDNQDRYNDNNRRTMDSYGRQYSPYDNNMEYFSSSNSNNHNSDRRNENNGNNCDRRESNNGEDTRDNGKNNQNYDYNNNNNNRNSDGINRRLGYNPYSNLRNIHNGNRERTQLSDRTNKDNSRLKRFSSDESGENQCIPQCVFGYMELLDDDKTPSESLIIKWLQEHMNTSDLNRIKALREARRCFARLTTKDIDDGCEFSLELSKCLQMDLENY